MLFSHCRVSDKLTGLWASLTGERDATTGCGRTAHHLNLFNCRIGQISNNRHCYGWWLSVVGVDFYPETGKCATSLQLYAAGNHKLHELTSCGKINVAKVRRWRQGSRTPNKSKTINVVLCGRGALRTVCPFPHILLMKKVERVYFILCILALNRLAPELSSPCSRRWELSGRHWSIRKYHSCAA
jgi:hypothetical protein